MGLKYVLIGKNNPAIINKILLDLQSMGYKVASLVSSAAPRPEDPQSWIYQRYTRKEISEIIDNNSYLFWGTLYDQTDTGLTIHEFEDSELCWMPVPCARFFNKSALKDNEICFIWIDDTLEYRTRNTLASDYDARIFSSNEYYENLYSTEYTNLLSTHKLIYFNNEDPDRISTLISILLDYPQTSPRIIQNFN